MRKFWSIIYYGFARHLPKSTMPVLGKFAKWLRHQCAKHMFAECKGKDINLEQGAYIGNGRNFYILGDAAIGKDFVSHNRIVTIRGKRPYRAFHFQHKAFHQGIANHLEL